MKRIVLSIILSVGVLGCSKAPAPQAKTIEPSIAYGIPVSNKPGWVKSPYAPDQGEIDVSSFKRDQQVKCPFTQKVFLVP